jgi:hypothetical protein
MEGYIRVLMGSREKQVGKWNLRTYLFEACT